MGEKRRGGRDGGSASDSGVEASPLCSVGERDASRRVPLSAADRRRKKERESVQCMCAALRTNNEVAFRPILSHLVRERERFWTFRRVTRRDVERSRRVQAGAEGWTSASRLALLQHPGFRLHTRCRDENAARPAVSYCVGSRCREGGRDGGSTCRLDFGPRPGFRLRAILSFCYFFIFPFNGEPRPARGSALSLFYSEGRWHEDNAT